MPISRRQFSAFVGATGISAKGNLLLANDDGGKNRIRVIAYNVFAGTGWPNNRELTKKAVAGKQMAKRFAMELAIYDPDIINFSESPNEELVKEIAGLLEMNYVYFPSAGNWPGALLSRFEIVDSKNVPLVGNKRPKELFTRHWGRGTIRLPNGSELIVHSAHLYPTADPAIRLREIRAMLKSMKADIAAGRSTILIGDLNHGPDADEYQLWMDAGWVDSFARVGKGRGFTYRSDIPKWRIDYVMAAGPISKGIIESRPLFVGAFRLNIDDRQSFALSDHLPQMTDFEIAD